MADKSDLLQVMSDAVNDLEQEFHDATVADRVQLRPKLEALLHNYASFRLQMLKDTETVSQADLDQMKQIKGEIDAAAQTQQLLAAIAKTAAFIATKL
jgi:hypothetical protein